MTDNVLYYPYISLPNNLWTFRTLLYYDNVGIIVPNDYIYDPDQHSDWMLQLIKLNLVRQIDPLDFTRPDSFKKGFLDELLSPKRYINSKRRNFENGQYSTIHVQKFDYGLIDALKELDLARDCQDGSWYEVEPETAYMLMTYLATIISIQDQILPITDIVRDRGRVRFIQRRDVEKLNLRERILEDILPLPAELSIKKLEKFKGKYQLELTRFRRKIESLIIELNRYKDDINDFEELYKLRIEEIKDEKKFLVDKMKSPGFGKVFYGTICTVSASGIAIADTPTEKLIWSAPSLVSTAYRVVASYRQNEILKKKDFRYLALVDKKL